jgi:hypothetical protein
LDEDMQDTDALIHKIEIFKNKTETLWKKIECLMKQLEIDIQGTDALMHKIEIV